MDVELDQITDGVGKPDDQQVKKLLGYLRPGRATAGWDTLEVFRLIDTNGAPLVVNLGGKVTLRSTTLPNSNNDTDYYAFRPKRNVPPQSLPPLSFSRSGNNIVLTFVDGVLQSADKVTGPFNDIPNATTPYTAPIQAVGERYYRAIKR